MSPKRKIKENKGKATNQKAYYYRHRVCIDVVRKVGYKVCEPDAASPLPSTPSYK